MVEVVKYHYKTLNPTHFELSKHQSHMGDILHVRNTGVVGRTALYTQKKHHFQGFCWLLQMVDQVVQSSSLGEG